MKHIFRLGFLALFLLATSFAAISGQCAETFPDKPPPQDFFVDRANLISEQDRKAVNDMALSLWKEKQIPIYVVTIDTLSSYGASGLGIEGYARSLFDHWGIGSQSRNYGMLLLVSNGDRAARIQLGGAFAHEHDAQAEDVMQSLIIPAFKRGDFSTGIRDGVKGLDSIARGLPLPTPTVPAWTWIILIGGAVLFIALIFNLFKNGKSGWAWALIAALGVAIFFLLRNSTRGGGDSSGGFGGGSSGGGGGASGSW